MIKLASPDIRQDDLRRANRVIRSGNLVQGKYVARFETALSGLTGVEHCSVVSSGTAALHLALLALGVRPGDGVLVPAFTFPATANVVERLGARTVLCDVDATRYVMTPEAVAGVMDAQSAGTITAVIVVHEFGFPADIEGIRAVAKRHGARVIEDAACALGTLANGRHAGHFGDLACLSFHPRKALTTGEGGAVLSRDAPLIARIKELRSHGIRVENGTRDFVDAGLNYRMTDFQAALGVGQVPRFPRELTARRALAVRYLEQLRGEQRLRVPATDAGHSWQSFMVVLSQQIDRDGLIRTLRSKGIESGLGAQALHCLRYYRERYGYSEDAFPAAAELYRKGLSLPMHGRLATGDVDRICGNLRASLPG